MQTGGTYITDGVSRANYNGQAVAKNNNVVVVTLQYRMGVFGYAGAELLRSLSPDGSTGNYGLQDQRLGMAWARANVAAFGGDSKRIYVRASSPFAVCADVFSWHPRFCVCRVNGVVLFACTLLPELLVHVSILLPSLLFPRRGF